MTIDIPTLALVRGLIQIVLAGLIYFLWRHDRQIEGPPFWALGFLLNGTALVVFPLDLPAMNHLLTITNHLAIGLSGCALMLGFWQFNRQPVQRWALILVGGWR